MITSFFLVNTFFLNIGVGKGTTNITCGKKHASQIPTCNSREYSADRNASMDADICWCPWEEASSRADRRDVCRQDVAVCHRLSEMKQSYFFQP